MTSDPEAQIGGGGASGGEGATDMGTLLTENGLDYKAPQRGEIIEGVVLGWDRDGAIIDIGSKTEGVLLRHEMRSLGTDPEAQLQAGAKVLVWVLQSETAEGQVLLSLDRARGEQGWRVLQDRFESGESFEGEVTGHNRGGLLVNVEGVNAFVPFSQVVGVRPDRGRDDSDSTLAEVVGRTLRLKVIEINRRRNRVILSERAALQEWRLQQKERLIQELREGDIRRGRISSVRSFGVFIDLGGADGLAHLSELSWERDKSPSELFRVGEEVDVYVTKIDPENKKIALSLRRANPGQWEAVVDKYTEGQVVTGLVTKLVSFGAFARIEGPVEGLIHVSELVDRRIGHPKEVAREGDLLPLKIVRIERDRHRLGLSLRRAREEGETMGFVFSDGGEVISVPEDIRAEFEAREGPLPQATTEPVEAEEEPAVEEPQATVEPAEAAVAEEPATAEEPTEEEPAAVTAEEEPQATTEPAEAEEEPAVEEPQATVEPAEAAVAEEPATVEPAEAAVAEEPATAEEPTEEKPAAVTAEEEPQATAEPAEAAVAEEPATAEEPTEEEPAEEEPQATTEPAEAAVAEEPAEAEEPTEEEPAAVTAEEEPQATAEPAEAAVAEEPAEAEEPTEEEPAVEEPQATTEPAEAAVAEEPATAEEPTEEEPAEEEPQATVEPAEATVAEEPATAEEPTEEEPAEEEPQATVEPAEAAVAEAPAEAEEPTEEEEPASS